MLMRYSWLQAIACSIVLGAGQLYASVPDSLYLPREEFRYADNPRYTFLGGTPKRETQFDLWPTVGMSAAYLGMVGYLHYNQATAWWSENGGSFHVVEDIEYARGLDKCGHFFSGFVTSTVCSDLLMEAGASQQMATLAGAGMGLVYMTYVEVMDGFASNWGFSPSDAIANTAGVAFFVAQSYAPVLQNFTPRWSYIPTSLTGDADINIRPKTFIDDYNGTTFWLACNVNNLLPTSVEGYWPDWLMVSVGYGIRNYAINDAQGQPAGVTRRFLIGLDYDWVKILPESSIGFVNYLRQFLNYVRLPGPTLEVGDQGTSFGLVYPFAIVVRF